MSRTTLWRAALLQSAAVSLLSIVLALALPHSFFVAWGWIVGPAAWALCASTCARVLHLAAARVLLGAALAGVPSLLAVLVGVHWLGAAMAIGLFAWWCAHLRPQPRTVA
ncbi:MAG: hypothetical protein NVSMB51_03990 [Solirubrobacteraceae bacterium]